MGEQRYPAPDESQLRRLAERALPFWQLTGSLTLLKLRENAVYRLDLADGRRFALRVHRAFYHSIAAHRAEHEWVAALNAQGFRVPQPVPGADGTLLTQVALEGETDPHVVDLVAWVDGGQLGSVETGLAADPAAVDRQFRTLGMLAAKLHNHSATWNPPAGFVRHAWDLDGLVGDAPFWGRFWDLPALTEAQRTTVLAAREKARRGLMAFGAGPDRYGLIHADMVPENVLVDDGQLWLIDFDDGGYGWFLFEIATALYFIQPDPNYAVAKTAMIEGYRTSRPLLDEMLGWLPLFMMVRSFTYLGWVHTRKDTETAKEMTPFLIDLCLDTIAAFEDAPQPF